MRRRPLAALFALPPVLALPVLALVLIVSLCGFGWLRGIGGNIASAALQYITTTYTSSLANSGFIVANAPDCSFFLNGTAAGANLSTVQVNSIAGVAVGDEVYDGNYYNYFPFGTTISSISGSSAPYTLTLSQPASPATATNQALGLWISPVPPAAEWTWDNTRTVNQPQNALTAAGGEALATLATGVADGTAAITGVNTIYGAAAGWWIVSDGISQPVQIASISGTGPYSITLVTGANADITTAGTGNNITLQPNEPTIVQYRNSAEGTTAAASFNGYIVPDTVNAGQGILTVTAMTSGMICAPSVSGCTATTNPPLYYAGTGLSQGTYILSQLTGTSGGTGTYEVSDSQTLGTPNVPVALQTMGKIATFHTAYGANDQGGAFSYGGNTPTYQPGDVYEVLPAIYAGVWQYFSLVPEGSNSGCNAMTAANSRYVSCPNSGSANIQVGDYLKDSAFPVQATGYISGTTMTVLGVGIGGNTAAVGELVTGNGAATGTIITACGAGGCAAPGNFTVGCMSGASGGCASQTVGSPASPVALLVEGDFPEGADTTVTAVYYPGGNLACPDGTNEMCFQVSSAATATHAATDNFYVSTVRPMQNITVEGVTQNINGTPTRPAIAELGGSASYNLQGILYIGNYGFLGTISNLLVRNIDVENPGVSSYYPDYGTEYLVFMNDGVEGTTTLAQMRVEDGIWLSEDGMGIHTADTELYAEGDVYSTPSSLPASQQIQGNLNFEQAIFDWNGGTSGPSHNIYIGGNPNLTFNFLNSWSHHANYGHLIKSRVKTNIIGSYLEGTDALSGIVPPQFKGYIVPSGPTGLPTLTVTQMLSSGTMILPGQILLTTGGVASGTTIGKTGSSGPYFIAGSGTPGGVGQYIVSISQTVGSSTAPVTMEADYYNNNPYPSGPVAAEAVNAEFPCGRAVTIKNTILTKGMSDNTNSEFVNYNAESAGYAQRYTTNAATPLGSNVLHFAGPLPISLTNSPDTVLVGDATNPSAFPWNTATYGRPTSTSATLNVLSGESFTASISGTTLTMTGLTGGFGVQQYAPLWDAANLITPGTVITTCPGASCGAYQVPNPSANPVVSTPSGSLPAGTYYVAYALSVGNGVNAQTLISPVVSVNVAAGQTIQIAAPSASGTDASGWMAYVGTSSSTLYLQNTANSNAPLGLSTAWTQGASLSTATGTPTVNGTGAYTINQSMTVSSEAMQTGCGGNVCEPVQNGDTIVFYRTCAWGTQADNSLTAQNDTFVNWWGTMYENFGKMPFSFLDPLGSYTTLPGDSNFPFNASSDWLFDDDVFAGFCSGPNNPSALQDNSTNNPDVLAGNVGLYYSDFPWKGDSSFAWSGNPHVQVVLSPAELNQSYQQNLSPRYGDSSDSAVLGTTAYGHAAQILSRGDEAIGAVD